MKILNVNKFHYLKGGSETYYFALRDLLMSRGHHVVDFAMKHERNEPSLFSDYFVDEIDYEAQASLLRKMQLAGKIIYSSEARHKIKALIKETEPDIVHLNIFQHQLSPSILYAIKEFNLPVVYTMHDLKMLCPNYLMMSHGKVCEKCKVSKYYQCTLNKCTKDSFTKSLVNSSEMYIHRWLKVYDMIDFIIPPSKFFGKKLIEYGVDKDRIRYNPNFLNASKYTVYEGKHEYCVYLGRLFESKGVMTLIKAMGKAINPKKLIVVGDGPQEDELIKATMQEGLNDLIEFVGFKTGEELIEILRGAQFAVIPSESYENAPYAVLELMALGKAIIASNTGGLPELVDHGKTGQIYKMGSVDDLAAKISNLSASPDDCIRYGQNARHKLEEEFNSELHYERLMAIYEEAMNLKR